MLCLLFGLVDAAVSWPETKAPASQDPLDALEQLRPTTSPHPLGTLTGCCENDSVWKPRLDRLVKNRS